MKRKILPLVGLILVLLVGVGAFFFLRQIEPPAVASEPPMTTDTIVETVGDVVAAPLSETSDAEVQELAGEELIALFQEAFDTYKNDADSADRDTRRCALECKYIAKNVPSGYTLPSGYVEDYKVWRQQYLEELGTEALFSIFQKAFDTYKDSDNTNELALTMELNLIPSNVPAGYKLPTDYSEQYVNWRAEQLIELDKETMLELFKTAYERYRYGYPREEKVTLACDLIDSLVPAGYKLPSDYKEQYVVWYNQHSGIPTDPGDEGGTDGEYEVADDSHYEDMPNLGELNNNTTNSDTDSNLSVYDENPYLERPIELTPEQAAKHHEASIQHIKDLGISFGGG